MKCLRKGVSGLGRAGCFHAGVPAAGLQEALPAGRRRNSQSSALYCGFQMFLLLNVLSFFLPACLPFGPLAV